MRNGAAPVWNRRAELNPSYPILPGYQISSWISIPTFCVRDFVYVHDCFCLIPRSALEENNSEKMTV